MNEQSENVWMKGYLPDGRQVSITANPSSDVQALVNLALSLSAAMTAANITVNLPGLEPGENKEQIVTVMRRAKPADGTPIIDFYPAWGDGGDEPFGTYKYLHVYFNLNKPEMVTDFLAASGFKSLEDIPLYDAQSPLKRTKGRPHAKETAVPRPFFVVKKQGDEKIGSDGQPYHPWELVRYESNGGSTTPTPRIAPLPATGVPMPSQPAPSTNGSHSSDHKTITWPSKDALDFVLAQMQRTTGVIDMSISELARLAGIENLEDLTAWGNAYSTGNAAYLEAIRKYEDEQRKATPKTFDVFDQVQYMKPDKGAPYLRFTSANHRASVLCWGRSDNFKTLVGEAYYTANRFDKLDQQIGEPFQIAPLEIIYEYVQPKGAKQGDGYLQLVNATPIIEAAPVIEGDF